MLWGSDRYSNPVQMVLEGWLLSIISFWLACNCVFDWYHDYLWACFEKDKTQASMIIGRWNIKYWKSFSGLLLKTWLCFAYALWCMCAMEITKTITPRILILAWLGWYADCRFRHTAGLIFVMRLYFWSLRSRTTLYSCKGQNRWQSTHELMSSQAREIQLCKNVQICVLWMQQLLRFQCYFGCSCLQLSCWIVTSSW